MISKGFYFSSKIEKNKGDRDFKLNPDKCFKRQVQILWSILRPRWAIARPMGSFLPEKDISPSCKQLISWCD